MLFLIILLMSILLLGLTVYFNREVVYPKVLDHTYVNDKELDMNNYDPNIFNGLRKENIQLTSYYGYELKGQLYLTEKPEKFVLMCHGITSNYDGMKKYCSMYIKLGYSILLYDHRNHGWSDRNYTSFGYFEKKDAKRCVDYLMKRFDEPIVGVHGESMGAATALQLATIDNRLNFCVEDCGYSDLNELLKFRVSEDNHPLLASITQLADWYTSIFYKFRFKDASVIHFINKIQCPVLFIHGEDDRYVPYYMVHDLYEAYNGEKMLYSVPGATHAKSILIDPKAYEEKVIEFLSKYT